MKHKKTVKTLNLEQFNEPFYRVSQITGPLFVNRKIQDIKLFTAAIFHYGREIYFYKGNTFYKIQGIQAVLDV